MCLLILPVPLKSILSCYVQYCPQETIKLYFFNQLSQDLVKITQAWELEK